MFAVDHAVTALLLKRRYPTVPIAPLLLAVQAMELAWVVFNYLGIEHTTTGPVVRALGAAVIVWAFLEFGLRRPLRGRAVGLGIASHLVLDLLTHAHDIVLWPHHLSPRLGLGLYGSAPLVAFAVEMAYGVACWWIYAGSRGLLAFVVIGNLANLSLLSATVPGPEMWLAGRPLVVVTVIAAQIVVTLLLTGVLARRPAGAIQRGQSPNSDPGLSGRTSRSRP